MIYDVWYWPARDEIFITARGNSLDLINTWIWALTHTSKEMAEIAPVWLDTV